MYRLYKMILIVWMVLFMLPLHAEIVEGRDYSVLTAPQPAKKDVIEVVEFFSYGCPYCERLEPALQAWLRQKPENVSFRRFAIPRKGRWIHYARAYYSLRLLGEQEEQRLTPLLFQAIIHEKRNLDNEDAFLGWAQTQGVNKASLKKLYQSSQVDEKLRQAEQLAKAYQVPYVPAVYVNERFQLMPNGVTSYEKVPEVLNDLIQLAAPLH